MSAEGAETKQSFAHPDAEPNPPGPDPEAPDPEREGDPDTTVATVPEPDLSLVQGRLDHPVYVSDFIPGRRRRLEDGVEAILSVLGIAVVLMLGIYAQSTTQGVENDVRAALDSLIRRVVFLPLSLIEGVFVIVVPVALIVYLVRRRDYGTILHTVVTALASAIIGWGLLLSLPFLPEIITSQLVITTPSGDINSLNVVFMVIAAIATTAGTSSTSRSVKFTWFGVWILLFFSLIRGTATLPGILVTVLLGRLIGCLARWAWGFNDARALPADLVDAAITVGIDPGRMVRIDVPTDQQPLETWEITEGDEKPDYRLGQIHPPLVTTPITAHEQAFHVTPQYARDSDRQYQLWEVGGRVLDVHVLDPDAGLTAVAGDLWSNLRIRGMERLISPAIKINAQREMLAAEIVSEQGVRTPRPVALAAAGASVAVFWEPLPPTVPLLRLADSGYEISDDTLDQAWQQLSEAHAKDVCHRNLDVDTLTLDQSLNLWMLSWGQAEMGSGAIARRIDCAQMLVHLALATSVERAVVAAVRTIGTPELVATSLVMQEAVLPAGLRTRARKAKIIDQLRDRLAEITPAATVPEPIKLERFSPRTVVMAVILVAALVAVLGSLNFEAVAEAIRNANLWWMLAAFLIGCVTWVGAAIPLVAFAPKKIRLWNATLAQMAASIVTLVAPAGIGPAALNLRFLNREKLTTPVAVATVTLVQISQFLTSVVLLLLVVVGTGSSLGSFNFPTMTVVSIAATVAMLLAATLAVPRVRKWLWKQLRPFWDQVYPQLLWITGHPRQLLIAIGGNLLMNVGYIGAFGAALLAFGYSLDPITLALTYLVSSTLGSVIPTPGGIGPVEMALTAGLQVAGVPAAVALSAAVLFRLVTFYGRIPFGWVALKRMEKKGLL